MKHFLLKFLFFLAPIFLVTLTFYIFHFKYWPADKITNSYSLNEKLHFLKGIGNVNVLGFGSSITFNNLYSQEIVEQIDSSFVNASSWGIKIEDFAQLAKVLNKRFQPKTIICISNVMDFTKSDLGLDKDNINHLFGDRVVPTNLFDRYYFKHALSNKENHNISNFYTSLKFDQWGGVPLTAKDFKIDTNRWNEKLDFTKIDSTCYYQLNQLALYFEKENIRFIFVLSPSTASAKKNDYSVTIAEHKQKLRDVFSQTHHLIIDFSEENWGDSLFVDYAHLNENGARLLTKKIVECLNNN